MARTFFFSYNSPFKPLPYCIFAEVDTPNSPAVDLASPGTRTTMCQSRAFMCAFAGLVVIVVGMFLFESVVSLPHHWQRLVRIQTPPREGWTATDALYDSLWCEMPGFPEKIVRLNASGHVSVNVSGLAEGQVVRLRYMKGCPNVINDENNPVYYTNFTVKNGSSTIVHQLPSGFEGVVVHPSLQMEWRIRPNSTGLLRRKRLYDATVSQFNIMMLVIEGVSQGVLHTFAQELVQWLADEAWWQRHNFTAFQFHNFHTVQPGSTYDNLVAAFSGRPYRRDKWEPLRLQPTKRWPFGIGRVYIDDVPEDADGWIQNFYRSLGYWTLHSNDFRLGASPIGTTVETFDHVSPSYIVPGTPEMGCNGGLWGFDRVVAYNEDFWRNYIDSGVPLFGYSHGDFTHADTSWVGQARSQTAIRRHIQALMRLDPTAVIIFMADHGRPRRREQQSPFFYIIAPNTLLDSEQFSRMKVKQALQHNRHIIFSHYDLFHTLRHMGLLRTGNITDDNRHSDDYVAPEYNLKPAVPRAEFKPMSLLTPLPAQRGCTAAGITRSHCRRNAPPVVTNMTNEVLLHVARDLVLPLLMAKARPFRECNGTLPWTLAKVVSAQRGPVMRMVRDKNVPSGHVRYKLVVELQQEQPPLTYSVDVTVQADRAAGDDRWEVARVDSLAAEHRYRKYQKCVPPGAHVEFCPCTVAARR
jgi:hypothetical protein